MTGRSLRRYGLAAAVCVLLGGGTLPRADASGSPVENPLLNLDRSITFRNEMRKLWEDHITWTRGVIVSIAAGLPDLGPTLARLQQNQDDIGNAIKPYFGAAAGDQLATLLHAHISIAGEILVAAKAGNTAAVNEASARWSANADAIAAFLHAANPRQWSLEDLTQMMHDHLSLTLAEAVARLGGDFAGDIAAYDRVHAEILAMADMLSTGIIKRFPARFF